MLRHLLTHSSAVIPPQDNCRGELLHLQPSVLLQSHYLFSFLQDFLVFPASVQVTNPHTSIGFGIQPNIILGWLLHSHSIYRCVRQSGHWPPMQKQEMIQDIFVSEYTKNSSGFQEGKMRNGSCQLNCSCATPDSNMHNSINYKKKTNNLVVDTALRRVGVQ